MGYHRLLEDGSERRGALGSDVVVEETADEGRSGDGERVASVSMGTDRKANTWELVRAPSGRLQRLQRRVALEALSEFGSSFGTKVVALQTASMGEAGAEKCQRR
jgi:hypothetical protein